MKNDNIDFQLIFNAIPGAYLIIATDVPKFTIVAATDAYLSVTNTKREELIGKAVFDVFPENPDDSQGRSVDFKDSFERVITNCTSDSMGLRKYDIRTPESPDFKEHFWNVVNAPIMGSDGQVAYILNQVEDVTNAVYEMEKQAKQQAINKVLRESRDLAFSLMEEAIAARNEVETTTENLRKEISDRKLAEEKLQKAHQQLKFHLENSPLAVIEFNKEYQVILWSRNAEKMFGWKEEEILGKKISELKWVYEEDRERVAKLSADMLASNKTSNIHINRNYRKDGTVITCEWYNSALVNTNGDLVSVFSLVLEVTERTKVEQALRESNELAKQRLNEIEEIYRSVPIGLCVLDMNLRYVRINDFLARINGIPVSDHLGKKIIEVVPSLYEPVMKIYDKICETGEPQLGVELSGFTPAKPGVLRTWVEDWLPIKNNDGLMVGISAVVVEITERRHAEESLKKTMEALKRSNSELEQFAYSASHDLQEPLRMISNFSTLLVKKLDDKLDDETRQYLEFLKEGSSRMNTLIQGLLSISRISFQKEEFTWIDMGNLVTEVLKDLELTIAESKTEIIIENLPGIKGNPIQLKQLLQNLIGNAIKFKSFESPLIKIKAEAKDNLWLFSVSDNGIGIDPKYFNKIFLIFQRLNDRETYPGSGIGLSICKKVVENHGGQIWVKSTPDKGSTFYFTIPSANSSLIVPGSIQLNTFD